MSSKLLTKKSSTPKFQSTKVSRGVSLIQTVIAKYEEQLKHVKELTLDTMIPISMEDSNIIFQEIDIDHGGSISLDELFYYVVDKMVGLPYNYRSQIQKTIRKTWAQVSEGRKALNKLDFFKMIQYVMMWYRIYQRFKNQENRDNIWTVDEGCLKSSGLWKFVSGANAKEKLLTVTRGKRNELATFQDFIDYSSDLVSALLQRLVPYGDDDTDEEVKRLKALIEELENNARKLELEIQRLKQLVESMKPNDPAIQQRKAQIDNLLAQKENIRDEMDQMNRECAEKYDGMARRNAELEKENASIKDQFEDFKKKFIEEKNRIQSQLSDAHKEGSLKMKKAQEDAYIKDKIIESADAEIRNVDGLVKSQEANNRSLLEANKQLQAAFDDIRANAKQQVNKLKAAINDTNDQVNELSDVLRQKNMENKNLEGARDKAENASYQNEKKLEELKNELAALTQQAGLKQQEIIMTQSDTNALRSSNSLDAKRNNHIANNLQTVEGKNSKLQAQVSKMQAQIYENEDKSKKIDKEIEMMNKNLQNIKSSTLSLNREALDLTYKTNQLESDNNNTSSAIKILRATDVDLDNDINALKKRIGELNSRTSSSLIDSYMEAIKVYTNTYIKSENAMKESEYAYNCVLRSIDQPDWVTAMQTVNNYENSISSLRADNAKITIENNHVESALKIIKKDIEDYQHQRSEFAKLEKRNAESNADYSESQETLIENIQNLKEYKNNLIELQYNQDDARKIESFNNDRNELEIKRIKNSHKTLETKIQTLESDLKKLEAKTSASAEYDVQVRSPTKNFYNSNESDDIAYDSYASHKYTPGTDNLYNSPLNSLKKELKDELEVHENNSGLSSKKVEEKIMEYQNMHGLRIPFEKQGDRQFKYGSRILIARMEDDKCVFRVGGTWKELEAFVKEYEDEELSKMTSKERGLNMNDTGRSLENLSTISTNKNY